MKGARVTLLVISPPLPLFLLYGSILEAVAGTRVRQAKCLGCKHLKRHSLLYREWINNKVLLYSTGNYIQYPMINQNGKEYIFLKKDVYKEALALKFVQMLTLCVFLNFTPWHLACFTVAPTLAAPFILSSERHSTAALPHICICFLVCQVLSHTLTRLSSWQPDEQHLFKKLLPMSDISQVIIDHPTKHPFYRNSPSNLA